MQNSIGIFALALGLNSPWEITEVIFDKEKSQLDIYLAFEKGHEFT